jgi:predicted nucleic acid-binding Zn ribbon protein
MARARGPQPIGEVLAQLMARSGFARVRSASALEAAWTKAAGPLLAQHTRVGAVRRGKLEVLVAHSTLVQELGFQKAAILAALANELPDERIDDLRLRVGAIE